MITIEYMKRKQKQLERKRKRAAELEAKKEAARVAKMEAEAREFEEIAARKKLLIEQQEDERFHQKHIQRKEKLVEQKWDKQFDTLLAQIKDRVQKDNKLEEIRIIIQNREPSLQELDWDSWLSDPLNQKLADLDFDYAMEMFKRDNLMAKRRKRTAGHGRKTASKYALAFSGDAAGATKSYVTTNFNPDDYNLNLGFTVSYWVRPDEVGTNMFAFGRKHSNSERFVFGISQKNKIHIGTGGSKLTGRWDSGLDDNASGETAAELFPSLFVQTGGDAGDLIPGTWMHFVVTYADRTSTDEGNVARIVYLNGELIRTQDVNWSATGGSTGGMYFGARNLTTVGYNYGWACGLDQVAIFNTAKDAGWVTSVYNTDKKKLDLSNESGLVGYWKFDEGKGTTVKDYSGNGNHGTFAPISGDTTAYPTWEYLGSVVTR
jgi:hypothetical protein